MPNSAAETVRASFPIIPELEGSRILVTGAGGGIGAAIAEAFGQCRAVVGVHYHANADGAAEIARRIEAAGGQAVVLKADLTQRGEAERLVAAFARKTGGLDSLVNNAGGPELLRSVTELTDDEFDHVFDLNARCVFEVCRAGVPYLRKSPRAASIINVTSLSAHVGSGPGASVYGAAKAFVGAFSKSLARELAADGIRVNMLSPGFIATPLHEKVSPPDLVAGWLKQIPMGRGGRPDDCAGVALFLASSSLSGFITGQVIEVNGGQLMAG